MTTVEASTNLNKSANEAYDFLADGEKYKTLMPESVINWETTEDGVKFTIQNMAKLDLVITEKKPGELLVIKTRNDDPFPLDIQWHFADTDSGSTAKLQMNAKLNPFIAMVAGPALQKFADQQVSKLQEVL